MLTKAELVATLEGRVKRAADEIAKFTGKLATSPSPAYDLEWSGEVFTAAARLEVGRRMLGSLGREEVDVQAFLRAITDQALRDSRWPKRSTSVVANLMAQEVAATWADWAAEFGCAF